ncbi:MAG: Gfo/Idh/MocA family oxidoreductase [Bacteroidales bacterium]|nr:Gfo/Idh/MocA family oxidoreductase [Bacteroidales bacterium]
MIRFAVIGLGHIGKRHVSIIQQNPKAELVAVCDTIQNCDFSVPFFNSLEDLLESQIDIDVVNICTPNGLHATQAITALRHNKHVVIEKPIALKESDAEKIIATANSVGRNVFCVMQNRYSAPSQWLKKIIDDNILGEIFLVQVNCFWNRDERYYTGNWHGNVLLDGGTLFTQFSHFIDTLYWLFGDITNIKSSFNNFTHKSVIDFEDSGTITFDFVNGGMGTLSYSTAIWDKNMESSITIIGKNGTIKVAGQYMDAIEYCHIKDYVLPTFSPSKTNNHEFVVQNVIDTLHNNGVANTNAYDGMKVVDIIERIYLARETN